MSFQNAARAGRIGGALSHFAAGRKRMNLSAALQARARARPPARLSARRRCKRRPRRSIGRHVARSSCNSACRLRPAGTTEPFRSRKQRPRLQRRTDLPLRHSGFSRANRKTLERDTRESSLYICVKSRCKERERLLGESRTGKKKPCRTVRDTKAVQDSVSGFNYAGVRSLSDRRAGNGSKCARDSEQIISRDRETGLVRISPSRVSNAFSESWMGAGISPKTVRRSPSPLPSPRPASRSD